MNIIYKKKNWDFWGPTGMLVGKFQVYFIFSDHLVEFLLEVYGKSGVYTFIYII